MPVAKEYVLDNTKYGLYLNRDGKVKCNACHKKIVAGDKVVSRKVGTGRGGSKGYAQSTTHTVLYCHKCAKRVGIIN